MAYRNTYRFVLITGFYLTICLTGCTSPSRLDRTYFPMNESDAWVYATDGGDVVFEVESARKRDGITYYLSARRGGGLGESAFRLSISDEGVYLHGASTGGKQIKIYDPPFRQFAFGTEPGDTWKWDGKLGKELMSYRAEHLGVERISVPAGSFSAIHVRETMNGPDGRMGHTEYWLAKDVGIIQVQGKQFDPHNDKASYLDWKLKR